ncbi:hypothetical protein EVJ50_09645 [Synechococcus sp. RSCCF101]|uniref:hypothetical protein n=1 Tax=Synechococcus sp. RSCCF101 TaxID=2511069 RepID=UPI001244C4C9|nr:hypothetical protein [Synechococcus sp. RSCCF101]QEY32442.1 hypothetical protein EVJ50_09645 [Synechococcus sp. RSCCF101]
MPAELLPLLPAAFPSEAPFRVDQVRQAPGLMTALFLAQIALAAAFAGVRSPDRRGVWWLVAALFSAVTLVFFTLACWGTSDITKLNHYLAVDPRGFLAGEPLWWSLAPWIVQLPYRMAAVHGLTAVVYSWIGLGLARGWARPGWGGWWALLILTSPMLRGFIQNSHTRQALATALIVPLMLASARLLPVARRWSWPAAALSLAVHATAPATLLIALLPALVRTGAAAELWRLPRRGLDLVRGPSRRRRLPLLLLGLALLIALLPTLIDTVGVKLHAYLFKASFFSTYPLRFEVLELQRALAIGFVLTCLRRRLGWRELSACSVSRVLLLFTALYGLIQLAVLHEWLPQIAFRMGDAVGLFLLITALAWFRTHDSLWMLLPALITCLGDWGVNKVWRPEPKLRCGEDDDFLCIPDRWPDQVVY